MVIFDSIYLIHVSFYSRVFSGLLGVPPVNGVIPQAPMHTRACAVVKKDGLGLESEFRVREQRWTNLIQSILCGVCIFIPDVSILQYPIFSFDFILSVRRTRLA